MELKYTFTPTTNGMYKVTIGPGEVGDWSYFVCYSTHTDEASIDRYLRNEGFDSRQEYVEACFEELDETY